MFDSTNLPSGTLDAAEMAWLRTSTEMEQTRIEKVVLAVEPHIRAQAFAELADEFDKRAATCKELNAPKNPTDLTRWSRLTGKESAYRHAAEICRGLAVQEEEK